MSKEAVSEAAAQAADGGSGAQQDAGDAGYSKDLKARHVNMIAIGGAIGTGLFLGAGGRLHSAGPALAIAYLVCGIFAFFVVRALGELVLHRPSSGSFVSYAREFLGEKGAYVAGWMYFLNWSTTGIADITAIALYTHYWSLFTDIPQWVLALIALAVVLAVNLISVKIFGEMEFWFAIIKVAALVVFMFIGIFLLATQHQVGGRRPAWSCITDHGGLFPHGLMPVVIVHAGRRLRVRRAGAGRCRRGRDRRAGEGRPARGELDHVAGGPLLRRLGASCSRCCCRVRYSAGQSPFVTVLSKIGVPAAGDVMNLVVLTAAMSSLNSGPVLHRPHPALHGDGGLRAEVHRAHEPQPGPLRRHPAHLRGVRARRRPQLRRCRARPSRSC